MSYGYLAKSEATIDRGTIKNTGRKNFTKFTGKHLCRTLFKYKNAPAFD